mmetsp:Transcript_16958/g.31704  ORF Transcript_16958/g.31704 Transcript_16958/m.31704 type:complete len:429 (-) Transcript_16958:207-1493(-)
MRASKRSDDPVETCEKLLSQCEMFSKVPPESLAIISGLMTYRTVRRNEVLLKQSAPSDRFFLLESGEISRRFKDPEDGKTHNVEYAIKAKSVNSMKILSGDPVYATVKCMSEECRLYELQRDKFLKLLSNKPEITIQIAEGLCEEVRRSSKKYRTPLLQQKQQEVNVPAVAIAAGIESYYRSALNAMLNARLTGVKSDLFPNMHIQVPTRIAYIVGFKGLRTIFDKHVDAESFGDNATAVSLATAVAPGILMTPISSVLEASNAGHLNPESMTTRWLRGVVPRAGREIIFGVGLNQLSDYFEERMTPMFPQNPMMANAAGSLAAGVVSGYLSHVPHNLSTYKLMEPNKSYGQLFKMFVDKSCPPIVDASTSAWPAFARTATRSIFSVMFPRGVMIRTVQIVGSFMILNGTINYLQLLEHNKIQRALRG